MVKETSTDKLLNESCPKCHGRVVLEFDSEAGYQKICVNCGHIEYLRRNFIRWNRRHNKWE